MECYYCNANADLCGGIKCVIGCKPYQLKKGGIGCCYNHATVAKRMKELMNKPATNYDRIISKTPEELAELLDTRECPTERCPNEGEDGCIVPTASCRECWLSWLRQEVEE